MKPIFYTTQLVGGRIPHGAVILRADDQQQLTAIGNEISAASTGKITRWVPGTFTGHWLELPARPRGSRCMCVKCVTNAVHMGIPCRVQPPGFHPGGSTWWLTPKVEILVPVWRAALVEQCDE